MTTVCPHCGFHNPPMMRFCGNCGTRLPAVDRSSPKTSRESIGGHGQSAAAPEKLGILTGADLLERFRRAGLEASGQRRSVTVLFVDLSGYTHLSEELDDEALYELVQRYIRLLVDDVYKYEGMVDKLTGDGLMALFGAPIAHENNAERALRSAIDMITDVERLSAGLDLQGHPLRVHIGINSGSVIVGGVGSDGLMNYTAIGDSVNLARRLEESAEAGTINVSDSVFRQTKRLFDFAPLPDLVLKNISRPVKGYRLTGVKEGLNSARGLEGLRAPMIGRETELRQAEERVDRLVNDRQGGLVLVTGEGGMGKSRLVEEVKSRLEYSRLTILEGHSLTYRKSVSYCIFQDMLRNFLGLAASAGEGEIRQRLTNAAGAAFGKDAPEKIPFLEQMLSLEPGDPAAAARIRYLTAGQVRQQIFLAVRDLLAAEARKQPVLLILEDLHWADDASLELIRFLLDSARGIPLLMFAISRPFEGGVIQAIHERASQRLGSRYLYLSLQALPPDLSDQLLQALISIQDLPRSLRDQIIQRSAGLPFYLEEILRMLIENKIIYLDRADHRSQGNWRVTPGADLPSFGVPETLQGLILARFDRLSPGLRKVLQTASVLGFQFGSQVLEYTLRRQAGMPGSEIPAVLESYSQALNFLVEHEFILPNAGDAAEVEDTYAFKHVLVSDAVYSTLLQRDRRELHSQVGQAIEELYSEKIDSQVEVLAGHFLRSPLQERALKYLILAGQKAARNYANEQARHYFSQAADLLKAVKYPVDQAVEVHLGLGDVLLISGDYPAARDHFLEAFEILSTGQNGIEADATGQSGETGVDTKRQFSLLQRKIGQTYESQGEYDQALDHLSKAQGLFLEDQDALPGEQAAIFSDIGWIHFRRGGLDQAEANLVDALALAEKAAQPDVLASVLNRMAGVYFQRDNPEQAAVHLARSLSLRETIGDVVGVARSYNNLGLIKWKQGNLASALESFNHSFQLQANLGDVEGLVVLHTNMGLIDLDLGDLSQADHHFREALNSSSQIGHYFHVNEARMHLALLNVYSRDWHRVIEHGLAGLSGFQELGVLENQLDIHVSLGWAYLHLGDKEHLEEVVTRINEQLNQNREGAPLEGEGRAQRLFGQVAERRRELERANAAYQKAAAIFVQAGNSIEHSRVLVDLAALLERQGDREKAQAMFTEARETFQRMGARLEIERLDNLMQR